MSSEFTLPFDVSQGLRHSYRNPRDTNFLTKCLNVKPIKPSGLVEFSGINFPQRNNIEVNFPFPQLFHGKGVTLMADETVIYRVHIEDGTWGLEELILHDAYNIGNERAILPGGSWHFMDFHNTWALYNGNCIVFSCNAPGLEGLALVLDDIHIETACDFRGRAVIGGFSPDHFWNAGWRAFWEDWEALCERRNVPSGLVTNYMGENFVLWSSIGQSDMAFMWLIYSSFASNGILSITDSGRVPLMDVFARNEWGFMPMPWQGRVQNLKQLGKNVIVYGEDGVSSIFPSSVPIPTMGLNELVHPIGIASRSAVAGNDRGHVFLDKNGKLHLITPELQVEELDYEEYFTSMLGTEVVISYNPLENEFYISNKDSSYLLTQSGLCEVSQRITSCQDVYGKSAGVFHQDASERVEVWSDTFTGGMAIGGNVKTAMCIKIAGNYAVGLQGAFQSRTSQMGRFQQSEWVDFNDNGFVTIPTEGVEFRWGVRGNPRTIIGLNKVEVTFRIEDKRGVRGPYGDTAR